MVVTITGKHLFQQNRPETGLLHADALIPGVWQRLRMQMTVDISPVAVLLMTRHRNMSKDKFIHRQGPHYVIKIGGVNGQRMSVVVALYQNVLAM